MTRKISGATFGVLFALAILIPSAYAAEYRSTGTYPMTYTVAVAAGNNVVYAFDAGSVEVECGTLGGTGELNSGPSTSLGFASINNTNCTMIYGGGSPVSVTKHELCEYIFLTPTGTNYPYKADAELDGCFEIEYQGIKCTLVANGHQILPSISIKKSTSTALRAKLALSGIEYRASGCSGIGIPNGTYTDGEISGPLEIDGTPGIEIM
jgi:hypothetical protein